MNIDEPTPIYGLREYDSSRPVSVRGWIKGKRSLRSRTFLDLVDSSGEVQLVSSNSLDDSILDKIDTLNPESCVQIQGIYDSERKEVHVEDVDIIALATDHLTPLPRKPFDVRQGPNKVHALDNRHLYLRHPEMVSMLKLRSKFMSSLHNFFQDEEFFEFTAPVLTDITLYGEDSAFDTKFRGKDVYMTQCTAFYLESAIPALEKVYFMSPTFRSEKSRTKRHLSEYWHIKAETAFQDLEGMMGFVEHMLSSVATEFTDRGAEELASIGSEIDLSMLSEPFESITYDNAIQILTDEGFDIEWGKSLGADEERFLGELTGKPTWLKYMPRDVEPFPYRINPDDPRTTLVADLIVPGYGEILGTAEKIHDIEELELRMREDFVPHDEDVYDWCIQLRRTGLPPHSGFGMGVERALRWLLGFDHVRNLIPYPRLPGRNPHP